MEAQNGLYAAQTAACARVTIYTHGRRLFSLIVIPRGRQRSFRSVDETAACGAIWAERTGCFCHLFTGLSLTSVTLFAQLRIPTRAGGTSGRN